MLTAYQAQTQRLLQNPQSPSSLYDTASINSWINIARGQLAGDAECIRIIGTLTTVIGQRNYNFSAINIGTPAVTGAQGVIHVRRITYNLASGQKWITPRGWEWFDLYHLNNAVPINGSPTVWSQYGQGSAGIGPITGIGTGSMSSGSIYLDPPPDIAYVLNLDCVCYPIALAADTDVEAIPYLFSDTIPFFAAYYALLSSQTSARQADANRMFQTYQIFLERGRKFANPSINRSMYQQANDPVQAAKLGLKQQAQGG